MPLSNNNNEVCKEILEAGTCRIGFLHWQPRIQSHKCVAWNFKLEDNILEPRIYDLIKEESRKHKTDSLMADGGSLVFEKRLEQIVDKEFEKRGLQLLTFSAQLEFSDKVREKIDSRNEVNTNISVLDQQIEEQKKRNELEQLKTEQALIQSRGLTKEILYKQFINKWDGTSPLYGIAPEFLKITK